MINKTECFIIRKMALAYCRILSVIDPLWRECPYFWEWHGEQVTQAWSLYKRARLSASRVAAALGRSTFSTPRDVALEMLGFGVPIETNAAMRLGMDMEPFLTEMYARKSGNSVRQVGLVYPKFDIDPLIPAMRISVSPDGLVGDDGCIEMKTTRKEYMGVVRGVRYSDLETAHSRGDFALLRKCIYNSHYDQMQFVMLVCRRKWCDYVVMMNADLARGAGDDEGRNISPTGEMYIIRVPLDEEHISGTILPGLRTFFSVTLPDAAREKKISL
jgi:hypothetical protein